MGYLLKVKTNYHGDEIKMFYSKPEFGCYMSDEMIISRREYDEHYSKLEDNDFVFVDGWHDTTATVYSRESVGIDITMGTFYLDCILQGKGNELEYEKPYEFNLVHA